MSRELPYYKFVVGEWINGDITLEDYATQGVFTNVCAYYWFKRCEVSLDNLKRKYRDAVQEIDRLIEADIIKLDKSNNIIIEFLNEQREADEKLCVTNSKNGSKGGRPAGTTATLKTPNKTEEKPNGLFEQTQIKPNGYDSVSNSEPNTKAKKSNIEEDKEVDKDKEEDKETIVIVDVPFIVYPRPDAVDNFKSADDLKLALTAPTEWKNVFCKNAGIKLESFEYWLNKFHLHALAQGKQCINRREYIEHLNNWIKKQDKTESNFINSSAGSDDQQTGKPQLSAIARRNLAKAAAEAAQQQQPGQ